MHTLGFQFEWRRQDPRCLVHGVVEYVDIIGFINNRVGFLVGAHQAAPNFRPDFSAIFGQPCRLVWATGFQHLGLSSTLQRPTMTPYSGLLPRPTGTGKKFLAPGHVLG